MWSSEAEQQTSGGPERAQVLKDIFFPPNAHALRLINFICQSYLHLKVLLATCFTTNTINLFLLSMCSEFPHFQTLIDLIISKIADSLFWLISWGECQWFVVILGLLIQIFELVDAWKQYTNGGPDISLFSKNVLSLWAFWFVIKEV